MEVKGTAIEALEGQAALDGVLGNGVCGRLHGLLELCGAHDVWVRVEEHDTRSCTLLASWT